MSCRRYSSEALQIRKKVEARVILVRFIWAYLGLLDIPKKENSQGGESPRHRSVSCRRYFSEPQQKRMMINIPVKFTYLDRPRKKLVLLTISNLSLILVLSIVMLIFSYVSRAFNRKTHNLARWAKLCM